MWSSSSFSLPSAGSSGLSHYIEAGIAGIQAGIAAVCVLEGDSANGRLGGEEAWDKRKS